MKAVLRGSGWRHPPATIEPLRSLYLELSGLRLTGFGAGLGSGTGQIFAMNQLTANART